jgi:hypothetical protein
MIITVVMILICYIIMFVFISYTVQVGPLCVCVVFKRSVLGINGKFYVTIFTFPHLTHKVLNSSSADLSDFLFLRNLTRALHRFTVP